MFLQEYSIDLPGISDFTLHPPPSLTLSETGDLFWTPEEVRHSAGFGSKLALQSLSIWKLMD